MTACFNKMLASVYLCHMSIKKLSLAVLSTAMLWVACKGPGESNNSLKNNESERYEQLIENNKKYLMAEQKAIERYVIEQKWKSQRHSNGAHFEILKKGTSTLKTETGFLVKYRTQMRLLNGQGIYQDNWNQDKSLLLDKQEGEIGLHEILKEFAAGDSVRFILPSHLAFGVAGDLIEVGQRQPILYEMKILDVQQIN